MYQSQIKHDIIHTMMQISEQGFRKNALEVCRTRMLIFSTHFDKDRCEFAWKSIKIAKKSIEMASLCGCLKEAGRPDGLALSPMWSGWSGTHCCLLQSRQALPNGSVCLFLISNIHINLQHSYKIKHSYKLLYINLIKRTNWWDTLGIG